MTLDFLEEIGPERIDGSLRVMHEIEIRHLL